MCWVLMGEGGAAREAAAPPEPSEGRRVPGGRGHLGGRGGAKCPVQRGDVAASEDAQGSGDPGPKPRQAPSVPEKLSEGNN